MPKNEFWALGCTCEDAKQICAAPLLAVDNGGNNVIPIFSTKELAQVMASELKDQKGGIPDVIKIRVEIIERL